MIGNLKNHLNMVATAALRGARNMGHLQVLKYALHEASHAERCVETRVKSTEKITPKKYLLLQLHSFITTLQHFIATARTTFQHSVTRNDNS